jgi:AGCS family alanine or glycine:cation symporter
MALHIVGDCFLGVVLPVALLLVGLITVVRLRAFALFHPIKTLKVLFVGQGRRAFHALSMALAGTLGVGNIAGVALAVAIGGAGAVFWMWVSAFFAMFLKYAEIVLALSFRTHGGTVQTAGGAMYYMRDGVGGALGKLMSRAFAVLCLFAALTLGSLVQAGAVSESLAGTLGVPPWFSGVMLTAFTALVVLGGVSSIQRLTARLIPLLTVFYLGLSLYACVRHASMLPSVLARIFEGAFSPLAGISGIGGFFATRAVRYGVTRGLLSNEAGAGTAPMAHATAENVPASQGVLGIAEVFIDTFVLCTATAFAVLLAFEAPEASGGGVMLALSAFSALVGEWTVLPLVASVVLFVYATVICWCFYGESALAYLTRRPRARRTYLALFLLFLTVGCLFSGELVWDVTDLCVGAMTLLNLFALLLLLPRVREESVRGGLLSIKKKK